jgi:serine phosphatase RsbU (regulator of sigma subunit)
MYSRYEEAARKELLDSKETIKVQETVIDLTVAERKETKVTMEAFRNIQELSQDEILIKNITLENILKINQEITSIPKKDILLSQILKSIMPVFKAERGILFIIEKNKLLPPYTNKNKLLPQYTNYIDPDEIESSKFDRCKSIIRKTFFQKKAVLETIKKQDGNSEEKMSVLCSPLMNKDNLFGMIYIDTSAPDFPFKSSDIDVMEIFSAQAAIAIENSNLYHNLENEVLIRTKKLKKAYDRINEMLRSIEMDLRMAERLQKSILSYADQEIKGVEITLEYLPMAVIGGDIYDIFKISEDSVRIFLADAIGHGIQAALITMLIKGEYEKLKKVTPSPDKLLNSLNSEFIDKYDALAIFFTCFLLDIDLKRRTFHYAAGGHINQILVHNNKIHMLENTGKLIGLSEEHSITILKKSFKNGDKLFLFTDALIESMNFKEEMLSLDDVIHIIEKKIDLPATEIVKYLIDELYSFTGTKKLNDDLTIIGIDLTI